ncbi:MAG TPA: RNA polymerase sigma factor [Blastocatellia bacterium]|nr:RNA polymerase sigma factor [Blastocatellia bacterium]
MDLALPHSDDELLRLVIAGNEDAFAALYRKRHGAVYRFALQMSGSPAIAEDVTQEVFLVLIREARSYDSSRGSLSAFLYGIARNYVLRYLKRDRAYVSMAEDAEETTESATGQLVAQQDPLGDLTRNETIEAVRQAVLALPPHYREVVVLCDLHETSYTEAAGILGCAVGTIRSRLHRGRGILVEKLRAVDATPDRSESVRCFM